MGPRALRAVNVRIERCMETRGIRLREPHVQCPVSCCHQRRSADIECVTTKTWVAPSPLPTRHSTICCTKRQRANSSSGSAGSSAALDSPRPFHQATTPGRRPTNDQHREGRTSSQQLANHANTTGVVVGAFAGSAPPAVRKRGDRSVRNARESASRRCGFLATMPGGSYSNT
jgi:hypothetical protein